MVTGKIKVYQVGLPSHTVNVLKFRTPKKQKNTLNVFSSLSVEAKGSNKFCKRRQLNFAKEGNLIVSLCEIGYFPHRILGIFLFEIKILLNKFVEHLPYMYKI